MSDYLDPENQELLKDFFIEAELQVEIMERTILALESDPRDHDSIDELFRAAHTLKGGAYTVQMNELGLFTHKIEDLLDEVRDDKLEIDAPLIDLLLEAIDVVKEMLRERLTGSVYQQNTSELEQRLESWKNGSPLVTQAAQTSQTTEDAPPSDTTSGSAAMPELLSRAEYDDLCQQAEGAVVRLRVHFDESNPMNTIGAVQEFARLKDMGTLWLTHPDFEELYEDNFFEYVDYYLEIKDGRAETELRDYAMLPDVTLDIEIQPLSEDMAADPDAAKAVVAAPPAAEDEVPEQERAAEEMALRDGSVAAVKPPEDKPPGEPPDKKSRSKKDGGNASVLRVDSRRVDEILNLVSEAVINKATFNQIAGLLQELGAGLRSARQAVRDELNSIIEELLRSPARLNSLQGDDVLQGAPMRSTRKKLQDQASRIQNQFDPLENQLKNIITRFGTSSVNLARNTNDLHEAILSMRMVPISQVFSRFPRLVRDLSRSLDKKVELLLEGEETEIDKSVAEELLDPLMHCVRNSMDHGIEGKGQRGGKPETGQIKLSAINEGSNVIIEISDDGGGISLERVRAKAVANGVIAEGKVLSDQEAFNLIFEAGFSTAKEVSNISGRGVGLDVVKKQIEKLNGMINIWSEAGRGARFTIRLPLTLAIIQGLLVRVRSEVYAIPITAVAESIRITSEDIHLIDNYEVISVRDDAISLLRLNRLFQLEEEGVSSDGYKFVVVVGTEERRVGLMVDNLIGEEDVVIKPLVDRYTYSPGVAGATILGDGTVSLILDVSQLLDLGIRYERLMREQKRHL